MNLLPQTTITGAIATTTTAWVPLGGTPRNLVVPDADVRVVHDTVSAWQDQTNGGVNQVQPQIMPTPYNPAPFPNLPPGLPSPRPPPR